MITYRCQVIACQVINKASVNIVYIVLSNNTIQENDIGTRYQHEYRKIIQFLENSITKDFKLFTTIKKRIIIKLLNYPGGAWSSWSKIRLCRHYTGHTTKLGSGRS